MGDRSAVITSAKAPGTFFAVLARNWSFFFLLLSVVVFSFTGRNFFALSNFQSIIHLATTSLLLACAETFVIISGGIDMSVGFILGLSAVSSASTMQVLYAAGWSPIACVLLGIAVAMATSLALGFTAGMLVARFRVPPFIATLGHPGHRHRGGVPHLRRLSRRVHSPWAHGDRQRLSPLSSSPHGSVELFRPT